MIEARGLTRAYGSHLAAHDVTFTIAPGEVVGLLGHNGAGKTTVMKMLTGYLEPTTGLALINAVDMSRDPQEAQAILGYLPENLPLYPELNVADFLSYTAELRGLDPAKVVAPAMHATQISERAEAGISTLSRGYKQRLGVAQAILHNPRYLILDEPTNGLDPGQTQQMRALIRALAANATVMLSTHIMQEVSAVCDRVLIMRNGELVMDARLADLQKTTQLRVRTNASASALAGAGVAAVEMRAEGLFAVEVDGAADAATAALAERLIGSGAAVYELAPVVRDLEAVFREVTEGDSGSSAGGQV